MRNRPAHHRVWSNIIEIVTEVSERRGIRVGLPLVSVEKASVRCARNDIYAFPDTSISVGLEGGAYKELPRIADAGARLWLTKHGLGIMKTQCSGLGGKDRTCAVKSSEGQPV